EHHGQIGGKIRHSVSFSIFILSVSQHGLSRFVKALKAELRCISTLSSRKRQAALLYSEL
ncbi:MAG: hypothetical protein ORN52_05640, partial [Beijerinckiaceae bacterium]|nr:hypothetical protein [Beijerinckiaceae bacterium]